MIVANDLCVTLDGHAVLDHVSFTVRRGESVALLADTPILLLDEPSASLDRDGQHMFFDIVARLRKQGRTLLLASHSPEEVEYLTDRVVHLDRGRVIGAAPATKPARVIALSARGERR